MEHIELLPCPFCGNTSTRGAPILVCHDEDLDVAYVCCERCDARGPIVIVGSMYGDWHQFAALAEQRWNTRPAAQ